MPRATTVVVAAAGYGKTAWLDSLEPATGPRRLVDDVHLLDDDALEALLCDETGPEGLVLTSRRPLSRAVRARLPGPVVEVGPADLRLSPAAVAALLVAEYDLTDPELPGRVHEATAGWPMLVHLAADAARRHGDLDSDVLAEWLHREVLAPLDRPELALLQSVADLDLLTPALAAEVAAPGTPSAVVGAAYDRAVRTGLLVPHPRAALVGRSGHRLVPALAAALGTVGTQPDRLGRAAAWYERHDHPFAALDAHLRSGAPRPAAALLDAAGSRMISQGDAAGVVRVLSSRPDLGARRTLAEAYSHTGDSSAAVGVYAPLVDAAERDGWDVGLAVRLAAAHFSQGELARARDVLDRVRPDRLPDTGDGIAWRAVRANVASMLGDDEDAVRLAAEALALAERAGDPASLTAAHQAVAKTSTGSRKQAHLARAVAAARRDGDVVSLARILGNQTYALLAAARCRDAVALARDAVRATELVRPMGALIAALHNLAEALWRAGEHDEARWHLLRAAAVSQRIGPTRAATSLAGLGDLHRALGQREQARAAYEEAVVLARTSHELQVLVPALAGLARLVVDVDPRRAREAATEATRLATPSLAAYALVAEGWVEAAAGDPDRARVLAADAAEHARGDGSLDLLAEALELTAEVASAAGAARDALGEALSIWCAGGAGPDAARVRFLRGRLDDADVRERADGRDAAAVLQRLGIGAVHGRAIGADPMAKDVSVSVLGRFEVVVGGGPVPLPAWRSRQARTLVKILAAHRGRPASRARLCELLWPDDDPVRTSHRLSVLLTAVRSVLDPGRTWPPDRYVVSDPRGVRLDLGHVSIDAEDLLTDAEHGCRMLAEGDVATGVRLLAAVDARYRGEALPEEGEEGDGDWAGPLREQTRAAWLRSLRHLATQAGREGRSNDAAALLARLLVVDPYDERVHRGLVRHLVRSGRHGEARRAFDRWVAAMRDVDAPAPDPDELEICRPVLTPR